MRLGLASLIGALVLALGGCARGGSPWLMVQFCLTEAGDASALKAVMRQIAIEVRAACIDTSRNTEELDRIFRGSYPIINVSVRANHGIGVSVTNQGLPLIKSWRVSFRPPIRVQEKHLRKEF